MCLACAPAPVAGEKNTRRRKLWDLEDRFHCPVIGTCMTVNDLKRIFRQSGVQVSGEASDFDYHVTLTHSAGEKGRASRQIQKLLEKRYARHVRKISAINCADELAQAWDRALREDEVPGTLWALLTHPLATRPLLDRVYGEIHMLSHLSGRSHRRALGRIPRLEAEREELTEKLQRQQARADEHLGRRDARIRELEHQLQLTRHELAHAREQRARSPATDQVEQQLARESRRREWAEEALAERCQALDEHSGDMAALRELLEETRELLRESERKLALYEQASPAPPETAKPDLKGRHVVYIGGRRSLAPHLRGVVEDCAGRFTHHDGGLEDNRANLDSKLLGADVVFCPVDCISHDACLRVKRCCKKINARFVPLRSSGVSSLLNGLKDFSGRTQSEAPGLDG